MVELNLSNEPEKASCFAASALDSGEWGWASGSAYYCLKTPSRR